MSKQIFYLTFSYAVMRLPLLFAVDKDFSLTVTPAEKSMAVIEAQMSDQELRESPAGGLRGSNNQRNMMYNQDNRPASQNQRQRALPDDEEDDDDQYEPNDNQDNYMEDNEDESEDDDY